MSSVIGKYSRLTERKKELETRKDYTFLRNSITVCKDIEMTVKTEVCV